MPKKKRINNDWGDVYNELARLLVDYYDDNRDVSSELLYKLVK